MVSHMLKMSLESFSDVKILSLCGISHTDCPNVFHKILLVIADSVSPAQGTASTAASSYRKNGPIAWATIVQAQNAWRIQQLLFPPFLLILLEASRAATIPRLRLQHITRTANQKSRRTATVLPSKVIANTAWTQALILYRRRPHCIFFQLLIYLLIIYSAFQLLINSLKLIYKVNNGLIYFNIVIYQQ